MSVARQQNIQPLGTRVCHFRHRPSAARGEVGSQSSVAKARCRRMALQPRDARSTPAAHDSDPSPRTVTLTSTTSPWVVTSALTHRGCCGRDAATVDRERIRAVRTNETVGRGSATMDYDPLARSSVSDSDERDERHESARARTCRVQFVLGGGAAEGERSDLWSGPGSGGGRISPADRTRRRVPTSQGQARSLGVRASRGAVPRRGNSPSGAERTRPST